MDEDFSNDKVQKLLDDYKNYITNTFYDCNVEIFKGLGELYVNDKRFNKNINKIKEGLAEFISKGINYYVENQN
jgi:hypothetical protein